MDIWHFIDENIKLGEGQVLLLVLQSKGSSPGRQGFKMVITASGKMKGSIGGGIMEHKLIEKARDMLKKGEVILFFKHQIHRKEAAKNQSGMICSGEQTVILLPILKKHSFAIRQIIQKLDQGCQATLKLSNNGFSVEDAVFKKMPYHYEFVNDKNWGYTETLGFKPTIHIIGGGHVGRACCQLFVQLGFYIKNYDDRVDLNTMLDNPFAHEKIVVDYKSIGSLIDENEFQYIAIMTFGYRSDELVIRQLLGKKIAYLGMLGSKNKIEKLKQTLLDDGISKAQLDQVFMPMGIPIHSKTPQEIAVSLAAQIIAIKNRL